MDNPLDVLLYEPVEPLLAIDPSRIAEEFLVTDAADDLAAEDLTDEDPDDVPADLVTEDDLDEVPEDLVEVPDVLDDTPLLDLVIDDDLSPAVLVIEPIPFLEYEPVVESLEVYILPLPAPNPSWPKK